MSWSIGREQLPLPLLLATDFDGTLAPIVPDPMAARALPDAVAALWRLSRIPGVSLAVVSGRSLDAMEVLGRDLPPHWRAGEHGQSLLDPEGVPVGAPPQEDPRLDALFRQAQEIVDAFPGLGLERKARSVALHSRSLTENRDGAQEAVHLWCREAIRTGFLLVPGREVMELQLPGDGKWQAIEAVKERTGAHCIVYAGDDVTDMEALAKLGEHPDGHAVWVSSPERETPSFRLDGIVAGPEGWAQALVELASMLEESR